MIEAMMPKGVEHYFDRPNVSWGTLLPSQRIDVADYHQAEEDVVLFCAQPGGGIDVALKIIDAN